MLELLSLPLLMGVILTGIFAYLGIHIVEREVIFVDLALAQIAALGAAVGVLVGFEPHGIQAYGASLLFVLLGAVIFSLTRMKGEDVPQEAIIGIVYVVAAAAAILAFSYAPEATEKIRAMLVGDILFANSADVLIVLAVSVVVGMFHLIFRKNFLLISQDPDQAAQRGISLALWDFLFYISLGLVVVSAVGVAGILLVFSYLIIPAVCAMLLKRSTGARIVLAWGLGALATFLGIYFSVLFDLPTGATMVCTFAAILVVASLVRRVARVRLGS
jgi:zinc/manganese transport system permease protein